MRRERVFGIICKTGEGESGDCGWDHGGRENRQRKEGVPGQSLSRYINIFKSRGGRQSRGVVREIETIDEIQCHGNHGKRVSGAGGRGNAMGCGS